MTRESATVAANQHPAALSGDVRLRSVAFPVEHGGWGMLGEPLLLGLLVAPSWPALAIGLAAVFAFLARHPLKLAVADWRQHRRAPRTRAAARFAALYTAAAVAAAAVPLVIPAVAGWWIPLAAAAPFALVQLVYDVRNQGRQLVPETLGGAALGCVAAAEMIAGGTSLAVSFAAWAIVAAKAVAAVLYVRARLRADRGLPAARGAALSAHAFGLVAAAGLASAALAPWTASLAFAVLLARAAYGVSRFRRRVRPQVVGVLEIAYGVGFVLALAAGYRAGL
jgi:hypothetical protein